MLNIAGYLPISLIDFPDKLASVIFFDGCNFRCPFCQNADLVHDVESGTTVEEDKILAHLKRRVGLLDGVVLTGGEPLLQNIKPFVEKIKKLGFLIKLDTNGSNPDRLEELLPLVDYIAMDIKAPLEEYDVACGVVIDHDSIKRSVEIVKKCSDYEFRTTVVPKLVSEKDIVLMAEWIGPAKRYFLQQFVPRSTFNKAFEEVKPFKAEELLSIRDRISKHFDVCEVRGVEEENKW